MAKGSPAGGPTTAVTMRVEDLMFLDDLRALGIVWIDRLVGRCTSHADVERVRTLLRMWGPDCEDARTFSGSFANFHTSSKKSRGCCA